MNGKNMNVRKNTDRLTSIPNYKNSTWYVSEKERQFYEEFGYFDSEDDWLLFISERKAQSLDYARPLNLNLMASGPPSGPGINKLIQYIQGHTNKRLYQPSKLQLNCLLANLFLNYVHSPNLWIVISRANERSIIRRHNPMGLNFETIANICDKLIGLNFLQMEIGHTETMKGKNDGHLTRIRASDELFELLNKHGWQHSILHYHPNTTPVVMKAKPENSKTSKMVDYEDTEKTKTTTELLWNYYYYLRQREILLPTFYGDTVPDLIFMRQIFNNNSWVEGGRLFGGAYQQLSEEERKNITIDGEPVMEVDIVSCHATMAFAEAGIDWHRYSNQDIYQRGGLSRWPRNVIKRAFNIAINAENEKKAASALTHADNKDGWFRNHEDFKKPGWQRVQLDEIKDAYPEITHLLFKRRGMYYMRQEGEIGLNIINECMALGIPVLTLHDSFIAPKQYEQKLKEIILVSFKSIVGVRCKLK